MGIRKGWALCGAREERCFISHAVSSHPLLELQTLGLSTLSSPHHQDLPLDSIQKKNSYLPSFPPPLPLCVCPFFLFVFPMTSTATFHLPHPHRFQKTGTLWWLILCITSFTFPEDEDRKTWPNSGSICGQRAHLYASAYSSFSFLSFFFFFFLFSSSPSWLVLCGYHSWFCTCKWYGREDGGGGLHLDSLPPPSPPPPPPPLTSRLLLLFPGWSRSGLVSRSTLRNHGHGVSLGKQRPGQQGFTQTLIILRAISGGSPQLHTWLEPLSLTVQPSMTQENELILPVVWDYVWALKFTAFKETILAHLGIVLYYFIFPKHERGLNFLLFPPSLLFLLNPSCCCLVRPSCFGYL